MFPIVSVIERERERERERFRCIADVSSVATAWSFYIFVHMITLYKMYPLPWVFV